MAEFNINLRSRYLGTPGFPVDITVILPEIPYKGTADIEPEDFYKFSKKYRVLWVLHDEGGSNTDLVRFTNCFRYVGDDVMLVMPNAMSSGYTNWPDYHGGYNFYDFFFHELMPFIYGLFPASPNPKDNFIAGWGMGGNGALLYAASHAELFAGAASICGKIRDCAWLEPYAEMPSSEFIVMADAEALPAYTFTSLERNIISKYPTVKDYLASKDNIFGLLSEDTALPETVYMCCGMNDPLHDDFVRIREKSKQLGLPIRFESVGGHERETKFTSDMLYRAINLFGLGL